MNKRRPNRGGGRFNKYGSASKQPLHSTPRKFQSEYIDDDFSVETFSENMSLKSESSLPSRHKVNLQRINMSEENQENVKEMLKSLNTMSVSDKSHIIPDNEEKDYLDNEDYDSINWYPEKDTHVVDSKYKMENKYWLKDSQLVVEDLTKNEDHSSIESQQEKQLLAFHIRKLSKYGFHETHCKEALIKNSSDLGASLEYLLEHCFGPFKSSQDVSTIDYDYTNIELLEQRQEEITALESIYGSRFQEKIKNKVWVLSVGIDSSLLSLPKIKFSSEPDSINKNKQKNNSTDLCKYFLKGECRFDKNCKFKHTKEKPVAMLANPPPSSIQTDAEKLANSLQPKADYELELRFTDDSKYPFEVPYILFKCNSGLIEPGVCLNITERLIHEASSLVGLPAVFSLVSFLEDRSWLSEVLKFPVNRFSLSKPQVQTIITKDTPANTAPPPKSVDNSQSSRVNCSSYGDSRKPSSASKITSKKFNHHKIGENSNKNAQIKKEFQKLQSSSKYVEMLKTRGKLPAWKYQREILTLLESNQVIVVSGTTGCGKTTQVPQFILDQSLTSASSSVANIIVTQPRRISATSVAARVAQERISKVGDVVGYQIRLENKISEYTCLLFCTTGILLRRLEADSELSGVSHIIVDEVHERSQESDFLLMILRDLLSLRPDLKVILMSATIDADLFTDYFGGCQYVDIPGKTFPVEQYFLEDVLQCTRFVVEATSGSTSKSMNSSKAGKPRSLEPEEIDLELDTFNQFDRDPPKDSIADHKLSVSDLYLRYKDYDRCVVKALYLMSQTVEEINYELIESLLEWIIQKSQPKGAILVFLPGMSEITSLHDRLLTKKLIGGRNKHKFRLLALHSSLSSEDQSLVFNVPPDGVTKIVMSTNIAETSVTIEDIVYVIDCGKMKEKQYDNVKNMECLDTVWETKANVEQRKGRAGRVQSGVSFHLFTSNKCQHLRSHPVPEILRVPLEQTLLRIKTLKLFKEFPFEETLRKLIEPPSLQSIEQASRRLNDLGALGTDQNLTPLGYHLSALPVDVRIGKLMLYGCIFCCLDSVLTIASILCYRSPFASPFSKREEADRKKIQFSVGCSDHLTMLKAYNGWLKADKIGSHAAYNFCQENFLSLKTLQMLASMKRQYVELLSEIGFLPEPLSRRHLEKIARSGVDGIITATAPEINVNNSNLHLVSALLVAALYPNVIQIHTPETKFSAASQGAVPVAPKANEIKFKTKKDGYVSIHPSSVNFHTRTFSSPYLVFHELTKTSKVFVRDSTMVSIYPILLFAGGSFKIERNRTLNNIILSVDDGWIRFVASSLEVAELVRRLREELSSLLQQKIQTPSLDLSTTHSAEHKVIKTIVNLITTQ